MRLIDADKLIDRFKELKGSDTLANMFVRDVIKEISKQPNAYDVDKVVERLEKMRTKREEQIRTCADIDMADYLRCKMSAIAEAIEIVKSGGIK